MHQFFIQRAIELSLNNIATGGGPFGAVIVKHGTIIAEGANRVTTSHDPTAHAEVVAIRAACSALATFQLTGCTLYTSCEPCPMCLGAIYWARLDTVYFANTKEQAAAIDFDDAFIYKELTVPHAQRSIPFMHLADTNAHAAFAAWQLKNDKILY